MLGRGRGGIEQAALDYAQALRMRGHTATNILNPGAWVAEPLESLGFAVQFLRQWGGWDPLAAWRLRRKIRRARPDIIIAHGGRAATLACRAARGLAPVVAVAHNYQLKRLLNANACFAITPHLADALVQAGMTRANIHLIPNMVRLPAHTPQLPREFRSPPVIGTMGRWVAKKGFDVFLQALAILKTRGVAFSAVLGGAGEEERALQSLINTLGLSSHVSCPGWVEDRAGFFAAIDLFCLPSHHEPFGIVLLEAMAHGAAVVTTDSEGPRHIVTPGGDALMAPRGNAEALADALGALLQHPDRAYALAEAARRTIATHYTIEKVGEKIETALLQIIASRPM